MSTRAQLKVELTVVNAEGVSLAYSGDTAWSPSTSLPDGQLTTVSLTTAVETTVSVPTGAVVAIIDPQGNSGIGFRLTASGTTLTLDSSLPLILSMSGLSSFYLIQSSGSTVRVPVRFG